MTALDHYRHGARLLAEAEEAPAGPLSAKLLDQARAHFDAARTLIAAVTALDMPDGDYAEWERVALATQRNGAAR